MSQAGLATVRGPSAAPISSSARPRIVVILPRGEAIRNFVYSGALATVADAADVTVLSVIPSDELHNLLSNGPFTLKPLHYYPERWPVGVTRDLLDMAHGRRLWSKAAQERWLLRDYEARTAGKKVKRWTKKLVCYPFATTTGLQVLSRFERTISRLLRSTDEYIDLYRQVRPHLVFNASHVHSSNAVQAVQAAQWLGIPTATFIFSWDNLTSQGRILPAYDHYLVWNQHIERQLLRIYPAVRPNEVSVTGTPQFDFHFRPEYHLSRGEFCRRVGADPTRPIVLYSTGMANHMPGEDKIVERIADMVAEMTQFGPPQLLVRVYPKDLTRRFEPLKARRTDILFPSVPWEPAWLTPKPEDLVCLTNTLRHCDAGINIASTISLELCMMDKPVLNVGYNPADLNIHPISFARYYNFDHYRPVVDSGAVEVAYSEESLSRMLMSALAHPRRLSNARAALVEQMFSTTLDGRCADRVAAELFRIAYAGSNGR